MGQRLGEGDVADQLARRVAVDAHVDHRGAGRHPVAADQPGAAHGGDEDLRPPAFGGEVAGAGMGDCHRRIRPQQQQSDGGTDSNENSSRREELTNFEVSTRTVQTVREAFVVRGLSIAVLVNKERLVGAAGGADAIPVEQQLYEVEQLVASAAGFDKERGDKLKVAAVSFANGGAGLEPVPPLPWSELLLRQAGTMINAATILIVAGLVIWFGLRPAVRAILARPERDEVEDADAIEAAMLAGGAPLAAVTGPSVVPGDGAAGEEAPGALSLIEDLTSRLNRSPQKRLEQIVEFDEEQAAAILRQWLHQDARA